MLRTACGTSNATATALPIMICLYGMRMRCRTATPRAMPITGNRNSIPVPFVSTAHPITTKKNDHAYFLSGYFQNVSMKYNTHRMKNPTTRSFCVLLLCRMAMGMVAEMPALRSCARRLPPSVRVMSVTAMMLPAKQAHCTHAVNAGIFDSARMCANAYSLSGARLS